MNVKAMRRKAKLTQAEFWNRIGITQSGGCRYEAGRRLPEPVRKLLAIAYGTPDQFRRAVRKLRSDVVVIAPK